jgi:CDP-4-dehydro-6-deoxyglucose reductase, E3
VTKVTFNSAAYTLEPGETLLTGLTRRGQEIPHSCLSGACQTCLMQLVRGEIPAEAQKGLKETFRARGYFLACQCTPDQDMEVRLPGLSESSVEAELIDKHSSAPHVMVLRLRPRAEFSCVPGQYIQLLALHGVARSYSVASDPARDGFVELHVRHYPQGQMSGWLHDHAKPGDRLHLRGPAGECFYTNPEGDAFPMLLAGTGTGLAPLYGIARDALHRQHQGKVTLLHGALRAADLYYASELRQLEKAYPSFKYIPCTLEDAVAGGAQGPLTELLSQQIEDAPRTRTYLCGAPDMVRALKREAFLAGIASQHIYSDAFLYS